MKLMRKLMKSIGERDVASIHFEELKGLFFVLLHTVQSNYSFGLLKSNTSKILVKILI